MIRILHIAPGSQTKGNSSCERLARYIDVNFEDITVDMYDMTFNRPSKSLDCKKYDLIWGDMDFNGVIEMAYFFSKKFNKPLYIHGEWVPPYRVEEGWEEYFNESTSLRHKRQYMSNISCMQGADLVSLALSSTPGGFDYIESKFNVKFKNSFVRYPSYDEFEVIRSDRTNDIATIARVYDGKKRVVHTLEAIKKCGSKYSYKVLGTRKQDSILMSRYGFEGLGYWDKEEKVKIFAESKIAVQHWSGVPPAEAMHQFCPVISYDIPYMRELYGDALIWVEKDNIDALASTIDYWLTHEKERKDFSEYCNNLLVSGQLNVQSRKLRSKQVVNKIKEIL